MARDFDVEPFKDRLTAYVNEVCGSFREFEDICGLTHAGIGAIGKQGPTLSYLARISDTFPDLNMNWLVSGRGEKLLSGAKGSDAPLVQIQHAQTVNIGNWSELVELLKQMKQ